MWWKKRAKQTELAEDAKEDLAVEDKDADKVSGGGGQPHMDGVKDEQKV
jgi:hypothetical protein